MKKIEIDKINPWEISSPPKFVIQMIPAAQARSATLLISKGRPPRPNPQRGEHHHHEF